MRLDLSAEELRILSIFFNDFVSAIKDTKHEISICPDLECKISDIGEVEKVEVKNG